MFKGLILLCSVSTTPQACDGGSAVRSIVVGTFENVISCQRVAYATATKIKLLGTYFKVECRKGE